LFDNDISKFNFSQDLSEVDPFASITFSHTDLPKLRKGMVGGQFWSTFIKCNTQYLDAVERNLEQMDVVYKLVEMYPEDFALATTSKEVEEAMAGGKIASMMGVEGGHAINSNLAILRTLYRAGARYMTLSHACNTPWIDSANVEFPNATISPRSFGLSEFGVNVVREMNRLGMMIDLSHVSSAAMRKVLTVTEAPVIFSHSGARAIFDHARNVPDDVLHTVKLNGGVVMVIFFSCYLVDDCPDNKGTIKNVIDHIDHIRELAGVDHVGLGSDYNGVPYLAEGLEDVSKFPDLFEVLIEESKFFWTDEDLAKLASKNVLRVMKQVETVRDRLKEEKKMSDHTVMKFDYDNEESACKSRIDL